MNKLVIFIFLLFTAAVSLGQGCLSNLEKAQRAYFDGQLREVVNLLSPCIASENLSGKDLEASHRLLINALLILDEDSTASHYMEKLLSINPLTKSRSSDLIQYKNLLNSFELTPKLNIAFVIGLNSPSFTTLQYRSISAITDESDHYDTKPGISFGFRIDQYLTSKFFLSSGIKYNRYSYKLDELLLTYQQSFIEERLDFLSIPLLGGIQFPTKHIDLFVMGGIQTNILLTSKADLELFGIASEDAITIVPGIPEKAQSVDLSYQRKRFTINYELAMGVRKNIGLFALELIASYEVGANNLVRSSGRYSNEEVWSRYSYVPNDFKMDAFNLSLAISKRFFKPIRREQL